MIKIHELYETHKGKKLNIDASCFMYLLAGLCGVLEAGGKITFEEGAKSKQLCAATISLLFNEPDVATALIETAREAVLKRDLKAERIEALKKVAQIDRFLKELS